MLTARLLRGLVAAVMLAALVSAAAAGPIADFDAALRAAYADYRGALALTNAKNRDGSEKALAAFDAKWSALFAQYRNAPPPHYAEDTKWSASLDAVSAILARAKAEVGKGDLAASHESLEKVRDVLGDLRARNGIIVYSDRVNAFHHVMEVVLGKSYGGFSGAGLSELVEDTAVLAYLAGNLKTMPPGEALNSAEFAGLVGAVLESVNALQVAARAGDAARIAAARSKIKPAFAKLFVKFG